jgi:hypothetical protein
MIDFSWALTTGYSRYGIIMEVLYGLILTLVFINIKEKIVSVLLGFVILFQFGHTFQNMFVKEMNLSWHDFPDLFRNKELFKENAKMVFHDYGHITDKSNILPTIDALVTFEPCHHDGWAKMMNKKAAIYELSGNRPEDSVKMLEKNIIRVQSQTKNVMAICNLSCLETDYIANINKKGYLASNMYEVCPDFAKYNEPAFLFRIKYLDTSKYTIKTTSKLVVVGGTTPTDSVYTFQSNLKSKIFIRESPYIFAWPINIYELYANDKKYPINSKSQDPKIISLDTNNVILRANQPKTCLVIIQEIEKKSSSPSPK